MKGETTDVVVIAMGPGAAGKSTFIRNVLKLKYNRYSGPLPTIGNGIGPVTENVTAYIVDPIPAEFKMATAKRLVVIDTPGADGDQGGIQEMVDEISQWFRSNYDSQAKVAGVIYMYPICCDRMKGTERANLQAFRKLCGEGALGRVFMVTTMWDSLSTPGALETGYERERSLRATFWQEMSNGGSSFERLDEEQDSAEALLRAVLAKSKALDDDLAAKRAAVRAETEVLVAQRKALPRNDPRRKELKAQLKAHKEKYANLLNEKKQPFFSRFFGFLRSK